MTKISKRILALVLAMTLTFVLCSCKNTSTDSDKDTDKDTSSDSSTDDSGEIDRSETLNLEIFSAPANFSGEMTGWFGGMLKEKFNVTMNVIAPNIAGEAIYQTRAASGNLGDILILDSDDALDCYTTGLLYDITDYYEKSENLKNYELSVKRVSDYFGTESVYGVNNSVALSSPEEPIFQYQAPYVGSFMRVDYYDELGRPEMKDWQGMLDVLKQMQDAHPVSEVSEGKVYGFSLFPNWDGDYMGLAGKFGNMYGYSEGTGFYFTNQDATDYQAINEDDGVYHKGLEILFTANQMGLVDPESTTQDWSMLSDKTRDGEVLFAFWGFQAVQFNRYPGNMDDGKMIAYLPVGDQKMITDGGNPYGDAARLWAIGSQTKDIDRTFEIFDWMASPEYVYSTQQSGAGIEGVTYEFVDGKPVFTEMGVEMKANPEFALPDDILGGGLFTAGLNQINASMCNALINDTATGEPYSSEAWSSYLESNRTAADDLYADVLGYDNAAASLLEQDLLSVIPGTDYTAPMQDTLIATMRTDCGSIIKQYSWQMVFAKDRAEFDALWNTMKSELEGFGMQEVLDYDLAEVAKISEARVKVLGK